MRAIAIRIASILFAIGCVILMYYATIWVLGMFGLHVPALILQIVFVLIGLLLFIWALSGRLENFLSPPVP